MNVEYHTFLHMNHLVISLTEKPFRSHFTFIISLEATQTKKPVKTTIFGKEDTFQLALGWWRSQV